MEEIKRARIERSEIIQRMGFDSLYGQKMPPDVELWGVRVEALERAEKELRRMTGKMKRKYSVATLKKEGMWI